MLPCLVVIPASLRFQPTRRPQLSAQKAKAKAVASKFALPTAAAVPTTTITTESTQNAPQEPQPPSMVPKTTLADWIATASDDDDVNNFYSGGPKRERGGRKKRKKKKQEVEVIQNWDDIYDPSRPSNYEEYKRSEEKIREIREWKDLLYRHKMKRRGSSESDSESYRPMNSEEFNTFYPFHADQHPLQNSSRHQCPLLLPQISTTTRRHLHPRLRSMFRMIPQEKMLSCEGCA